MEGVFRHLLRQRGVGKHVNYILWSHEDDHGIIHAMHCDTYLGVPSHEMEFCCLAHSCGWYYGHS